MANPDLSTVTDEQLCRTAELNGNPLMWELAKRFRRDAAIAQAARDAGLVVDGKLRTILGTLEQTEDGCIIGAGARLWLMLPREGKPDVPAVFTVFNTVVMQPDDYKPRNNRGWSTRSAAEAAKGGGDAQ